MMDCAPEWAPGRESSLRSAGWASQGSGEALHLAVGRHVRARKLPLELVWIKNHPDDGSTSVYCSTDEKCRLGANGFRKRPTSESKRYWDFVGSASGDFARRKGRGTWCVWR